MLVELVPAFLNIGTYFVEEMRVKANRAYDYEESPLLPSDLKVDVSGNQTSDNPMEWTFRISIELGEWCKPKCPYTFLIAIVGFFEIREGQEYDNPTQMIQSHAPAILYSAARDVVAFFTSRGPYSPIILPSVSFIDSLRSKLLEESNEKLIDSGSNEPTTSSRIDETIDTKTDDLEEEKD